MLGEAIQAISLLSAFFSPLSLSPVAFRLHVLCAFVQHLAHSCAGLCWAARAHSSPDDELPWQKVHRGNGEKSRTQMNLYRY